MKKYLDLLKTVLTTGKWQQNRTGIRTISAPGQMLKFDLQEGFPAMTTRKLAVKTGAGELVGFLRAESSAAGFRALGCKVWDQNANENKQWLENPYREGPDHLGDIYGVQWRKWPAYKQIPAANEAQLNDALDRGYEIISERLVDDKIVLILFKEIDQVRECLDKIVYSPEDRRILFHGWNPAVLDQIALPSCHLLYQFHANKELKELSMTLFIRSSDGGLGLPLNVHEAGLLLSLMSHLSGYTPRLLTIMLGDSHIYENQLDMVNEQFNREPYASPRLRISERVPAFAETGVYQPEWLDLIEPSDFILEDYKHHAPLTAAMAV
jgi:thymidylate synthase